MAAQNQPARNPDSVNQECESQTVFLLLNKSRIFIRQQDEQLEGEQWRKIAKWFTEIYKTRFGSTLFDAAAQCEELEIIFDFDYELDENVDLTQYSACFGVAHQDPENIFINAKTTGDKKQEQQIKGIIAFKICHFVLNSVFKNNSKPYFSDDDEMSEKFDEICSMIESMLFNPQSQQKAAPQLEGIAEKIGKLVIDDGAVADDAKIAVNDECEGIISQIYTKYPKTARHAELIARPVQIQALFDDDIEKVIKLEAKFEILFQFFQLFVIPEVEKFSLKLQENIQKANELIAIISKMQALIFGSDDHRTSLRLDLADTKNWNELMLMWKELQKVFASAISSEDILELVSQKLFGDKTSMSLFIKNCDKVEIHENFWEFVLKSIENREVLKNLLMQVDEDGNNFIHCTIFHCNPEIIEFTLKKIKENFNNDQREELLRSKGVCGRNLLQIAAVGSEDIERHQILWKFFKDFCKSDEEFLKLLKEVDSENNSIFQLAAAFTSSETFNFMIKEFEKIASHKEIRNILNSSGIASQNLLQTAALQNKSLEFHQSLWKIIRKYFNSTEILDMIKHKNKDENNVIFCALQLNTREIVEQTWNEIKATFSKCEDAGLKEYIRQTNNDGENILHASLKGSDEGWDESSENSKYFWTELVIFLVQQNSINQFRELVSQKSLNDSKNVLHYAAKCDKIGFHEFLWELLLKTFENREELKELMLQEDKLKCNFIHNVVVYNKADVIEFTFKKIKEHLGDDQYEEFLNSKVSTGGWNLLQLAAVSSCYTKTHQILWKILQNSCKSDEEFLKILKEINFEGYNVFQFAAAYTTKEDFEFMIETVENLASKEEIRSILTTSGICNENILQSAATHNRFLELQENLWEVIQKYFSPSEIVQKINHCDNDGDNILHDAVHWNTKEVAEFTWKQIQKFIATKEDLVEYLCRKGQDGKNLLELSSQNQAEDPEVQVWVQNLMSEFKIKSK